MITILGDKSEDSSVGQMAARLAEHLRSVGHEVLVTSSVNDAVTGDLCVNLMMTKCNQLHTARRYGKVRKVIQWYAQNPENFRDDEVATQLLIGMQGKIVVQSVHLQDMLGDFRRRVFSASVGRAMMESMIYTPYGISDAFQWGEHNDRNRFIVPYNRVNETFKRFSVHCEITTKLQTVLAARGETTTHHFVKAKDMGMGDLPAGHPYVVSDQPTRAEYEATASQYGMFLCTSRSESFGIYYMELLFSGVVGVFLDAPWVEALLPGYPFTFKTKASMVAGAASVHQDYAAARSVVKSYMEDHASMYRLSKFHAALTSLIEAELPTHE